MLTLAQFLSPDWLIQAWAHVPVLFVRTIISFITVLVVVRWTGKRSIANLAPFDLAMVIMIGEVAAIPIAEVDVDLLHGILPVALIGSLHVVTTWLALRSNTFEQWTEGSPTLLVKDGQVLRTNLIRERVSMADLMTALRHKEVTRLPEVEQAWIEHAGGISVIRKPEERHAELKQLIEEVVQAHGARIRQELAELLERHLSKPGG
ncbi:MAG: hypothetical protein JWN15_2872 [Firmicutes bacterium]|nr:hypothetical protein [Bacillota bacterium]